MTRGRIEETAYPWGTSPGLTKRELFAAFAMQGLAAYKGPIGTIASDLGRRAVDYADALIMALNEEP